MNSANRKLSILYVSPGLFDKGGIARYGRYQVKALRESFGDDSVNVLSLRAPESDGFEEDFSVSWHGPSSRALPRTRFVGEALRSTRSKPDIVWSGHVNFSALTLALARLANATPVMNIYGWEVWSKKRPDAEWGLKKMPYLVSDCHFTADYVKSHLDWAGKQIFVAWDCVDHVRFSPAEPIEEVIRKYGLPVGTSSLKVLMLGRISHGARHKGWERLIQVASALQGKSIDFVLAGDGDFRSELEQQVRDAGLESRFWFTGSVDEKDLVDIYRYCDVFSLVSDRGEGRGEGLPLTPLEAASCGKPIIVGNQDGSQEAVENGENGTLVDPFDIESHSSFISRLSDDREYARMLGGQARHRVEEHFSYERFREKTASIATAIANSRM